MSEIPVYWVGGAKSELLEFPKSIRSEAGYELRRLQEGLLPRMSRPMKTVGQGVFEIKLADERTNYRVFYVHVSSKGIYVLHAFEKNTKKTPLKNIRMGEQRLKEALRGN